MKKLVANQARDIVILKEIGAGKYWARRISPYVSRSRYGQLVISSGKIRAFLRCCFAALIMLTFRNVGKFTIGAKAHNF